MQLPHDLSFEWLRQIPFFSILDPKEDIANNKSVNKTFWQIYKDHVSQTPTTPFEEGNKVRNRKRRKRCKRTLMKYINEKEFHTYTGI